METSSNVEIKVPHYPTSAPQGESQNLWIQPSISNFYLSVANQRIVDGLYSVVDAPKVSPVSEQAWFWTKEWQAGERKVDEYIRSGNFEEFDTIEDFLDTLRGK